MTRYKKLGLLGTLYLAQGLPYGFFTQALPALLRKEDMTLPAIGATSLLVIPWALKFLWAPLVDRYSFSDVGHRRSWILPLQVISVITLFTLGLMTIHDHLTWILAGILLINLFSASQDIATDGLALDILSYHERGLANGIQVAGYRLGMVAGGGLILILFASLQWQGALWSMALMMLLTTLPVWFWREPKRVDVYPLPPLRMKDAISFLESPGAGWWFLILLVFKSGDAMSTTMLRPFLVDHGLSLPQIGWLLGTGGFIAGLLGAMTGGLLVERFSRPAMLIKLGFLQFLAVGGYMLLTFGFTSTAALYGICMLDHFAGGMATAALFTLMMDAVRPARAASDYTFQASTVVIATSLASSLSGIIAEWTGYLGVFGASTALCGAGLLATRAIINRTEVKELLLRQSPESNRAA